MAVTYSRRRMTHSQKPDLKTIKNSTTVKLFLSIEYDFELLSNPFTSLMIKVRASYHEWNSYWPINLIGQLRIKLFSLETYYTLSLICNDSFLWIFCCNGKHVGLRELSDLGTVFLCFLCDLPLHKLFINYFSLFLTLTPLFICFTRIFEN